MKIDEKQFFEGIALRLHESGAMKTYDVPQGQKCPWPQFSKSGHDTAVKNTPGQIFHIGDAPYLVSTQGAVEYHRDVPIRHEHIKQMTASVIKALRAYMPSEDFEQYLADFRAHVTDKQNMAYIRQAMHEMADQLSAYGERVPTETLRELEKAGDPDKFRYALLKAQISEGAAEYPELLLTTMIVQATQSSYLDKLSAAIQRHPSITDDEKENAREVIAKPLRQFKIALLHATMVPLTLMSHEEMPPDGRSQDKRMMDAISAGWDRFFDARTLVHRIDAKNLGEPENTGKLEMTCPAINALRELRDSKAMERTYEHVVTHRAELAGLLNEVYDYAKAKITTQNDLPLERQQQRDMSHREEPSRCPMRHVKKGFTAMVLGAAAMLPGHDVRPSQERPSREPTPMVQRHEELPHDKRPPKFRKPKWADDVLEQKFQKKDERGSEVKG